VHAANAGEYGVRMTLGPSSCRVAPFRRPLQVAELFARTDQAAIHLARRERAEATFHRAEHRLVQTRESFVCLALIDQNAAERLQRLRFKIVRAQLLSEGDHVAREHRRGFQVAASMRRLSFP
jgi:hypothetical protein